MPGEPFLIPLCFLLQLSLSKYSKYSLGFTAKSHSRDRKNVRPRTNLPLFGLVDNEHRIASRTYQIC